MGWIALGCVIAAAMFAFLFLGGLGVIFAGLMSGAGS